MKNQYINITVSVIILATLIRQSSNAVENGTRISLKHETTLHLNNDSNVSSQDSQKLCSYRYKMIVTCQQGEPLLMAGYCATYSDNTKLVSILECPYFQLNGYNYTSQGSVLLPQNVSQLSDYMCNPLNRKGLVCSECADGFGPSVTSFGYRCANCTDAWYGVPLFLFLEFVPITIFYIICLAFRISVTSAPMPCFIMYAQIIVATFDFATSTTPVLYKIIPKDILDRRLDIKIALLLYRVFNLEFGHYLLPPYCLSSKLKFIHVAYLGYISAFYPPLLIFLTWVCVELHGRNFRPLVWLWRPFHRCFVHLRRGWDTKSDIIDVFTTFFFLTYTKILYQTLLLMSNKPIKNIELSGKVFLTYVPVVDHSLKFGGIYHLSFAIPGILVSLIFNILPPLMLILYPIRSFRKCFSKSHLNFAVINTFLDKVHGCYRNGLDGGRDMRSFSGLYFILQVIVSSIYALSHAMSPPFYVNPWIGIGTLFFVIILAITIGKPYQKAYMNHLDTLLLSNVMILCYVLSSRFCTQLVARTLIATPVIVFIVIIFIRRVYAMFSSYTCRKLKSFNCFRSNMTTESTQSSTANTPMSTQPLLQPTSTVVSYGINDCHTD